SVRRTAELLRSWLGQQERWQLWRPLDPGPAAAARSTLCASTVQRWLNVAGEHARQTVVGQLAGVPTSGQLLTDGLWARLRGGAAGQRKVRRELVALVRAVLDAASEAAAQGALGPLQGHRLGGGLAAALQPHLAAAHVCHRPYTRQLGRVSPEWCWRDFRLHLSHGRNHGAPARLERAAL